MLRHATQRTLARGLVLPLLGVAVLGACSDDDDTASTCDARDDLQEALSDLADVDVVADGKNGIEDAVGEVQDALDELKSAAQREHGDEVDQVEDTLRDLNEAVSDAGDQSPREAVRDVSSAASDVASRVNQLVSNLTEEC